ncbi:MAG: aminopeptidase [Gaiellaceae bacterium]
MRPENAIVQLAELAVGLGANVQSGQIVAVTAEVGQEEFARVLTETAYRHGASFVDVSYWDPHVKRARIAHAADDTLEFVPPWYGERILALGEHRCATIAVAGTTAPGLLNDLDPRRAGCDQLPRVRESALVLADRTTNWTIIPFPTAAWAQQVHPELGDKALERLWEEVVHICRLDEPDPVAAWEERFAVTGEAAARLTELQLDALRLEGPGTDLTIGLLPTSRWWNARFTTVDGIEHTPNIPSEEVFTSPDRTRADGVVRSTKPLVLGGTLIRGLEVRFEGGRAVDVSAEEGGETMEVRVAYDEGASRLGEVALVDREGRIGKTGTTFFDTLIDENAASHLALGFGFPFAVAGDDVERVNRSGTHIDFMVGSADVRVTGITREGGELPVLVDGAWQI